MTELELRRNGSVHTIRGIGDIAEAAQTLERWARDWERAKRKAEA